MIVIFQSFVFSTANAKHYFVHTSYTENYRGSAGSKDNGVRTTVYVDSENIGRYIEGGKFIKSKTGVKGGLFRVRVIEVWDWDKANQYHSKQQVHQKDYYFYRLENHGFKEYSIFDESSVSYILAHDMPFKTVIGSQQTGLHCFVPRWIDKDGWLISRDELVKSYDETSSDWYLLKIYDEAIRLYNAL